jgi:steroid 5-alpha reductase family enzyme
MSFWAQLLIALAGLCGLFALLFIVARRLDNYSIVDVAWSFAFGPLAIFCAATAPGWPARRWLLAAMVVTWSTRLGVHLFRRVASHHPREDGRYVEMRQNWQRNFAATMFGFFQLQALTVVVLGLPFLLASRAVEPAFHVLEIAGAALWLVALTGEAVADAQLRAFKRDATHRGQVCDRGLWRYSRHPNYFFEWLIWVGYALFALASPAGWLGLIAPAAILYLLLRVSGVPPTEAQALRSKGDAYRRYQQTTSAFFPWFPRITVPTAPTAHPTKTSP